MSVFVSPAQYHNSIVCFFAKRTGFTMDAIQLTNHVEEYPGR